MRVLRSVLVCSFGILCVACNATRGPAYPVGDYDGDGPASEEVRIGLEGDAYADTDPSALSDYRVALDPHGVWVEDDTYGTVWVPYPEEVGADFTPYVTAGHWVYDDDYIWVSDYEWGWAPFHYGRWVWMHGGGWAWIPGRAYAGAWVVWRAGDDDGGYLGWAPMPPAWIWRHGVAVGIHVVPWVPYVFCPRGEIFAPGMHEHILRGERATAIAGRTRPYVQAAPVITGHPLAQPSMRGPPSGLESSRIVHAAPSDRGLLQAQRFARPSTAQPMGARPAVPHVIQTRPMVMPSNMLRPAPRVLPSRGGGVRRR